MLKLQICALIRAPSDPEGWWCWEDCSLGPDFRLSMHVYVCILEKPREGLLLLETAE